jgi:hypothetical protein
VSKKEYDAKEMAQAILKKAEQTIKNSKNFNALNKTDPQNMNSAQAQGLKGIKLPSAPKAPEKPEMKPINPPAPQAAAKMPKPLKMFMAKREMKKAERGDNEKGVANQAYHGEKELKGMSSAGKLIRRTGTAGIDYTENAKNAHKETLAELKAMPKPKLTKTEKE